MLERYFDSCDGSRIRISVGGTLEFPALRPDYSRHYREITTGQQLRATLRAGQYAWPGGYRLYFHMSDGCALCFDCCRAELRLVLTSIRYKYGDGWRVVGTGSTADWDGEDGGMCCDQCGELIDPPTMPDDGDDPDPEDYVRRYL